MSKDDVEPKVQLSAREAELIHMAIEGATDSAIANKLGISENTVSTYWGRIRMKLGPYSRTELVALVLEERHQEEMKALKEENEKLLLLLQKGLVGALDSKAFFQRMIESGPDAKIMVSPAGILIGANQAVHEMFGYVPPEMVGMNLLLLVPPEHRVAHVMHRDNYMLSRERRAMGEHMLTPALHRNGEEFHIRATLSTVESSDGLIVLCSIRRAVPYPATG